MYKLHIDYFYSYSYKTMPSAWIQTLWLGRNQARQVVRPTFVVVVVIKSFLAMVNSVIELDNKGIRSSGIEMGRGIFWTLILFSKSAFWRSLCNTWYASCNKALLVVIFLMTFLCSWLHSDILFWIIWSVWHNSFKLVLSIWEQQQQQKKKERKREKIKTINLL